MRITMKTLSASPEGTLHIGQTYDVPGQVSRERARELLDGGYAVREDEDPATIERTEEAADKPLEKRTVEQLKAYADEHDISIPEDGKKADILKAIVEALAQRQGAQE